MTDRTPQTGYAPVNGLNMYYEVHGAPGEGSANRPLVLLHGALATIDTCFDKVLPSFAMRRQVVAVEQQAHGHTADVDRPFSFEQMADDTATLLAYLNIENADFFGYSVGSGVAMQIAIRHPNLVRKLVFASPAYNREGFHAGVLEGIEALKPEFLVGTPWEAAYMRSAPRPRDWPKMVEKTKE